MSEVKSSSDVYSGVMDFITTCRGRNFHMSSPSFDLGEIAHALSMQCRFSGHVSKFYSVAEHCVLVASLMAEVPQLQALGGSPLEGLIHDAHEAYFVDMPSPWKQFIPDYRRIEKRLEEGCRAHFGFNDRISDGCKSADWVALYLEATQLLQPGATDSWPAPGGGLVELAASLSQEGFGGRWKVQGWSPAFAEDMYLKVFAALEQRK